MIGYIEIAIHLALFAWLGYYMYRKGIFGGKHRANINAKLVREFTGGDLYEIGLSQLEDYLEIYRTEPSAEFEKLMQNVIYLGISSQIARNMTDKEIRVLERTDRLHDLDGAIEKVNIDGLIPIVTHFALTGVIPAANTLEPRMITIAGTSYNVSEQLVKLLDTIKSRNINQEYIKGRSNA